MMKTHEPAFNTVRSGCDQPVADLSTAPLPTARTLRARRSLPKQLFRFVSFNLRIIRIVLGGGH